MKSGRDAAALKSQRFYKTVAWRHVRRLALQRDHYLCQMCLSNKRIRRARDVHHVQPLELRPDLALELSNLMSLCRYCHERTKQRGKASRVPEGVRIIKI